MQHEGYETGPVSTPGARTSSMPGSDYASLSRNASLLRQLSMPLMLSEPGDAVPGTSSFYNNTTSYVVMQGFLSPFRISSTLCVQSSQAG